MLCQTFQIIIECLKKFDEDLFNKARKASKSLQQLSLYVIWMQFFQFFSPSKHSIFLKEMKRKKKK